MMTGLAGTPTPLGDCALVEAAGIEIVLISLRNQAMGTDMFTGLGCDLAAKKIIVVKSSQHFYASFSQVARHVLYTGAPGTVTSELGSDYIVQSFMTVVVGGVGSIWGTLAGAGLIGGLQKGIEFLNPSNTLAAQTYMILFIILFIQVRPRGIIALRGRAAGD